MNIGIDIRSLTGTPRTGIGEYTSELITHILEQDKDNKYFLFSNSFGNSNNAPFRAENAFNIETGWPNKILTAGLYFLKRPRLDKFITKNMMSEVDLDIFFSPNINFLSLTDKIPHILTVHDLSFIFFKKYFSLKQQVWHSLINVKRQCQRANLILTPSQNTKNDIINYFGINEEKIKVIQPGLSTLFLKQDTASSQKIKIKYALPEKFIFFLGTMEPRKNIEAVIDGFLYWQRHNSYAEEYKLVIAGAEGWKCTKLLERILENKKIHYVGYIRPEEKRVFYELADIFVYPSFYEGFGFPVLEAMSVGTPVITSNRSSLPEVAGSAGYLINPHNIAEIAKGLQLITSDKYLKNELSERGFRQVDKFSWQEASKKWHEAVKEVYENRN